MAHKKVYLYLEDGTVLGGLGFGAQKTVSGEVVFTTAMNGYPESLTDPSYKGQILIITHPLVGNYGVPKKNFDRGILTNFESENVTIEGLVVSELTDGDKWNSEKTLDKWLEKEGVPGISGIDTRDLTKKVREHGVMMGVISTGAQPESLKSYFEKQYSSMHFVELVSPKKPIIHEFGKENVVVVDFGVKHGILQHLAQLHYNVVRVPYNYSVEKIMAFDPIGVVYGNGPGNPNLLLEEAKTFSKIMEYKIPTLAVCLGHQLAAIALGGKVTKMKFGHRAINKAVVDVSTHKSYITTHNHGYALYQENLPKEAKLWFLSPDDNVVEGMTAEKYNLITTQFHPEARPGTNDATFIFGIFEKMIKDAT